MVDLSDEKPGQCGTSEVVLRSSSAVTLVGGAGCRAEDLAAALRVAPRIVAVDSGAAAVLGAGLQPELVVGDMDSLDPALRRQLGARVREIGEQETTDFDKVLRAVEAPLMVGVGFLGARLDHELAAMAVLARSPRRCLLVGPHDVAFAARGGVALDLTPGTRVSLFPMAPVTGRSEGLAWPIGGLHFRPEGRTGTSNEATGPVHLEFEGPGMLVLLPRECMAAAVAALR
jgi:thiamine pyrophosphokinase